MAERRGRAAASLLAIPLLLLFVGLPTWWFVREGASGPLSGVPARDPAPDVSLPDAIDDAIDQLPERFENIPVLAYHDVQERDSPYALSPQLFAEHMAALERADVSTVSLEEFQAYLDGDFDPPARSVLLTFDDGPTSIYRAADSILERHGFTASSFMITSTTSQEDYGYHLNVLTVQEMERSGRWEFGAHTHDQHRQADDQPGRVVGDDADEPAPALLNLEKGPEGELERLDQWRARVSSDLDRNIELLRAHTGRDPIGFAYPFSAYATPTNDPSIPTELLDLVDQRFPIAFSSRGTDALGVDRDVDRSVPLPRLSVRDSMTATNLIEHLVSMTPPLIPNQLEDATLEESGPGRCVAWTDVIGINASGYTSCSTTGHRDLPAAFELAATVAGNDRRSTAIFGVEGANGRVEMALGESRAELRVRTDDEWVVVGTVPTKPDPSGSVAVSLAVDGQLLRAMVGDQEIVAECADCGRFARVVFAVATTERGVVFLEPTLSERARQARPGSAEPRGGDGS